MMLLCSFLVFQNCSSQQTQSSNAAPITLNPQDFVFNAQRANPVSYDAIKMVNSLPGGNSARILDLNGSNYTLSVKDNTLEAVLPYFGRLFNVSYDQDKNSYRFTSKDFTTKTSEGKRGKKILIIQPKDVDYVYEIVIESYPNGKAYLSIKGNDRQPISYDGYITKNPENNK